MYVPGIPLIGAQALSPLKYTVASGVPEADKSKVIIGLGVVPVTVHVIKLPAGNLYSFKLTKVSIAFE